MSNYSDNNTNTNIDIIKSILMYIILMDIILMHIILIHINRSKRYVPRLLSPIDEFEKDDTMQLYDMMNKLIKSFKKTIPIPRVSVP